MVISYTPFIRLRNLPSVLDLPKFYWEWMLDLPATFILFFCIFEVIIWFFTLLYEYSKLHWLIFKCKQNLHPWNKHHLVTMSYSF